MTRPVTLSEPHFSQHTLNKYASLMAQGNGYLGLRASHEEDYTRQTRGMYLAGLYHRAGKGEINELVNLPDVVGMEIAINGEVFSLSHEAWQRELDFASGELRRNVVWRTSNGSGYTIASRRFVSADQLPLIALEITITPLDADASVLISTGIDATQTNHGRQHLDETQVRVFGQHLMQGSYTTQDGRSDVAISCCCKVSGDVQQCYTAKERRLLQHTSAQLHAGETMTLQKLVWIDWRDDRQAALDEWGSASLRQLEMCAQQSYDQLLAASTENWRQWWQKRRITVNGGEAHDQQALDYALYHLRIMTPAHDERSSIAAKGLTGEGYKGHVFWDTEVFLLPFHLFSDPTVAEVYCVIAGTTCQARRRKRDATAGRARYFRGKARAAAKKRRRNLPPLTFAPGCGKKWPRRRRNIIWWPISPGRLFNTGRPRGMKVSLRMKAWRYFWRRQSSGLAAR